MIPDQPTCAKDTTAVEHLSAELQVQTPALFKWQAIEAGDGSNQSTSADSTNIVKQLVNVLATHLLYFGQALKHDETSVRRQTNIVSAWGKLWADDKLLLTNSFWKYPVWFVSGCGGGKKLVVFYQTSNYGYTGAQELT